jgi:hypothetical protein
MGRTSLAWTSSTLYLFRKVVLLLRAAAVVGPGGLKLFLDQSLAPRLVAQVRSPLVCQGAALTARLALTRSGREGCAGDNATEFATHGARAGHYCSSANHDCLSTSHGCSSPTNTSLVVQPLPFIAERQQFVGRLPRSLVEKLLSVAEPQPWVVAEPLWLGDKLLQVDDQQACPDD